MDETVGLFGPSGPLRGVAEQVDGAAATRQGVLITGEPGTGRGAVARAIHARQGDGTAPFVEVRCAALDRDAIEAELFGADGSSRVGAPPAEPAFEYVAPGSLLHRAMGGTIYIKNVEELPSRVQGRLARLFRDRECQTEPDGPPVPCDVRPIVAGDSGFNVLASEGRLRPDLLRRCSEIQIYLRPLRDGREDIPAMAEYLLATVCRKAGLPLKSIDAAARAVLAAMPWRGNARELLGLLETLAIRVLGSVISLHDLLQVVRLDGQVTAYWNLDATLRDARRRFEREYIAAVIAQHQGRVPDAAKSLGIQRTNLYRKLRALHVSPGSDLRTRRAGSTGR